MLTETWLGENMYCPVCGCPMLKHYVANKPVADFCCEKCGSDFELKGYESSEKSFRKIIADGAYSTMVKRITSLNNPNLFVMTYFNQSVNSLILIPKFFFLPEVIIKRKPLSNNARRAGWVGCNINIGEIPNDAKINVVVNGYVVPQCNVIERYRRIQHLQTSTLQKRGWIIDVMKCVDNIAKEEFSLKDVYAFEEELRKKHPENNFIKEKLRQQLQVLRDGGFIEFASRGHYRKIKI